MSWLLDTNACIAIINGRPAPVRDRADRTYRAGETILISSVTVFELWYGVEASARRDVNAQRLERFLTMPFDRIEFDGEDGRRAAEIRAVLKARGTPIGPYDLLIAGQAMRHGLTVVTANVKEFARVPGLKWEDWTASP